VVTTLAGGILGNTRWHWMSKIDIKNSKTIFL
jgi:hypothetical protein